VADLAEFSYGSHQLSVDVTQVSGLPISCGIYLSIVDHIFGFTGGYEKIGEVIDGKGEASCQFVVQTDQVPYGYVTFRVGVGLFESYDYTVKFDVKVSIDGVQIAEETVDMRTVLEVGPIKFSAVEEAPAEAEVITPEAQKALTPLIIGGVAAAIILGSALMAG